MKIKLKLAKWQDTRQEKSETFTYIWQPTNDKYKGLIELKIKDTAKVTTTDDYDLPTSQGDSMIVDILRKEKQKELPKK